MKKSTKNLKGQLTFKCTYERKFINGEIQHPSMHFPLRSGEVFFDVDFLTDQFKKLVLRENVNQPKAGGLVGVLKCMKT